jgi:5'-nucleotidase
MKILLTNDDGIKSPALLALSDYLSKEHEIWIFAPDSEKSGSSQSITLRKSIRTKKIKEREFTCNGTPVDCIILAFHGLVKEKIDMVISGPNLGPNLGTDILYSGTIGAARQAALMGYPSIAVSLNSYYFLPIHQYALAFIANNLSKFYHLSSKDHFLNINFPEKLDNHLKAAITFPSIRIYRDKLELVDMPGSDGEMHYRIASDPPGAHSASGSDSDIISSGMISLSPITLHPNSHNIMKKYRKVSFWTGKE